MSTARVAVIGGGISGLAAAHRLRTLLGPSAVITVLEQRDRIGGVLHTVDLAGVPFDVGAEAFLARRPELPALLAELGLAREQVHPSGAAASIRAAGRTRDLPTGTLLGIPTSTTRLDGLLSPDGVAAAAAEPALPLHWTSGADVALGGLLRERFGDELADRLVDPLLGGVYAGRVDSLGLRATIPALAAALDAGAHSLTAAADVATAPADPRTRPAESSARAADPHTRRCGAGRSRPEFPDPRPEFADPRPEFPDPRPEFADPAARIRGSATVRPGAGPATGPVFGAVRGGYRVLLDALASASGAQVRLSTTVRTLRRTGAGWQLVLGPTTAPEILDVDAVLLAVPAPALARLLADVAPAAARAAGEIELASSVVVALAYRPGDATTLPATSGALVAAGEPLSVKGVTHSTTKWSHLAPDGLVRLRASLGRFGEAASLQVDDAELVARVRADLAVLTGITGTPVAGYAQRWGGGLPQYGVGHGDRVRVIEDGLPPGLAVAGAALHGVGVPACVGTGRVAAERLASRLVNSPVP